MRANVIIVTVVGGVLALGGCGSSSVPAGSAPVTTGVSTGPDYSQSRSANGQAADVASRYVPGIEKDATYGGLAIVSSGLRVGVVGTPSPALAQALSGMRKDVPVTTWPAEHSLAELKALTVRINGDHDAWTKKGVELSSWGPDEINGVVVMTLAHYRPQAAKQLVAAYGSTWIRVSKRSETNSAS